MKSERPPAGYYLTNGRAVSLSEMYRMAGFWRLPFAFLYKLTTKPSAPFWMPGTSDALDCSRTELPAQVLEKLQANRADIQALGFNEFAYGQDRRSLVPDLRENGSISFLHQERNITAILLYTKMVIESLANREIETTIVAFTSAIGNTALTASNDTKGFDVIPGRIFVPVNSNSPTVIFSAFKNALNKSGKQPRVFNDSTEANQWQDQMTWEAFTHRVHRQLFIKMTDAEVAEAEKVMKERTAQLQNTTSH
ncbi:MAG TPA: hypothetical protein VGH19_16705 [Verrucomicrobiae bacterium]